MSELRDVVLLVLVIFGAVVVVVDVALFLFALLVLPL